MEKDVKYQKSKNEFDQPTVFKASVCLSKINNLKKSETIAARHLGSIQIFAKKIFDHLFFA